MKARMTNPAMIVPDAMKSLLALGKAASNADVPPVTHALVHLRSSQINGCSVCVDMHSRELEKEGETNGRIFAVAAWREAPYFSDAERAALALAESMTRLSDRPDPVPDDVWNEAARHYDEQALASLVLSIATVNLWNRLNAATGRSRAASGDGDTVTGDEMRIAGRSRYPTCDSRRNPGSALGETRTHTGRVLNPFPLPIGIRGRVALYHCRRSPSGVNHRYPSNVRSPCRGRPSRGEWWP